MSATMTFKGFNKALTTILTREESEEFSHIKFRDVEAEIESIQTLKLKKQLKKVKESVDNQIKKIDILKKDSEKRLRRTATKGVVQIFNAVRLFQEKKKSINSNAVPLDTFMELLTTQQ
jgi:uncharacterized phage infection (PIP) family protein YhgE